MSDRLLITKTEAATLLRLDDLERPEEAVDRLALEERLPYVLIARRRMFRPQAIAQWLEEREQTT